MRYQQNTHCSLKRHKHGLHSAGHTLMRLPLLLQLIGEQNSSLIRFTGQGPVLSSQHQQVGNATTSCIERKWDICLTSHITKTIISQENLHHFIHSFMKGNYFSLSFLQALKLLKASLRQVRCASLTTVIYLIIFTKLFSCLFSKFSLLGVIMHLYLSKTASYCNIHTEKIYSESHSVHA